MNFLKSLKLSHKLPAAFIGISLVLGISIGNIAIYSGSSAIEEEVSRKLSTVLESRKSQLSDYLKSIQEDLTITAANPMTADAVLAFTTAWQELDGNQKNRLQDLYINSNPNPTGEKDKLYDARDGSTYSRIHAEYHPWFHKLQQTRDYYDVFLFDLDGNLVYTVFKELDYATNLNSGQWRDTDLGNVFRDAAANGRAGFQTFRDFRPYAPSFDAPASFIATPVVKDGVTVGVLAFQMPVGRINAVMANVEGMGETGESYIVGSDLLMRSNSRFSEESTILVNKIDTDTAKAAIAGKDGIEEVTDYRGISVMSAYTPFDFMGTRWGILAEIDSKEFNAPIASMKLTLLVVASILLIAIGVIGVFFLRGASRCPSPTSPTLQPLWRMAIPPSALITPIARMNSELLRTPFSLSRTA